VTNADQNGQMRRTSMGCLTFAWRNATTFKDLATGVAVVGLVYGHVVSWYVTSEAYHVAFSLPRRLYRYLAMLDFWARASTAVYESANISSPSTATVRTLRQGSCYLFIYLFIICELWGSPAYDNRRAVLLYSVAASPRARFCLSWLINVLFLLTFLRLVLCKICKDK